MWIYEDSSWPNFNWDTKKLASKLADVRYQQGRLLGKMENLGFELKREAYVKALSYEIVKSSAIEDEHLNFEEVRSSVVKQLGIEEAGLIASSREVEGFVEMMLDATQNFSSPLTKERLFSWHACLFPTARSGMRRIVVGDWRKVKTEPMQVVSGSVGKEKVHFEAPHADRIEEEIKTFLKWFESKNSLDPVIKAGLSHFWFITLHPFEDGNGRIARVIADMALARADGIPERFYSLSMQIEREKKDYYEQLEQQQRNTLDVTSFLEWFLDCLSRCLHHAEKSLSAVLFKAQLWEKIHLKTVNERQCLIINRMLETTFKGHMNTSKYAKIAKCSTDTALRDIQDLKRKGVFIQNPSGGRSTSYRLPESPDELNI